MYKEQTLDSGKKSTHLIVMIFWLINVQWFLAKQQQLPLIFPWKNRLSVSELRDKTHFCSSKQFGVLMIYDFWNWEREAE